MNAASDEYDLESPATRTTWSYVSLADDAEAVRVVDVEEGVVLAGEPRERANVRGVAGHAVHAVDADEPRSTPVLGK